jgi:hypothetical protein
MGANEGLASVLMLEVPCNVYRALSRVSFAWARSLAARLI